MSIIDHDRDSVTQSAGEDVVHPAWCDPEMCGEDRHGAGVNIYHRSSEHVWESSLGSANGASMATQLVAITDVTGVPLDGAPTLVAVNLQGYDEATPDDLERLSHWLMTRATEYRRAIATEGGTPAPRPMSATTPKFTWRDLHTWDLYSEMYYVVGEDAERAHLTSPALRKSAQDRAVGGLLMWNSSQGADGGRFTMFTGQTAAQERQTVENAGWWISCGVVSSRARVKNRRAPDHRVRQDGGTWCVHLVPNAYRLER